MKRTDDIQNNHLYPVEEVVDPNRPAIPLEELPCSHHESLACMASICHHMGQPATVMLVSLNLLNKKLQNTSEDTRHLVRNLNEAADTISRMLRDMNKLCENTPVDEPEDYPDPLAPHVGHAS